MLSKSNWKSRARQEEQQAVGRSLVVKLLSDPYCGEVAAKILAHPEYERLKAFKHHDNSAYIHSLRVAVLADRLGRCLRANRHELMRGTLLHDFYLWDWREPQHRFSHGFTHASASKKNAHRTYGPLSAIETNVIEAHMWPLNLTKIPRYRETVICIIADRVVSSIEITTMFIQTLQLAAHKFFQWIK